MTRQSRASDLVASEWVDAAARSQDPSFEALLAIAAAIREQVAYCPLPAGYRAVYDCSDGSLIEEPIVAICTHSEQSGLHEPVMFNATEGFTGKEMEPIWYLAPGERLADVEPLVRDAIQQRETRREEAARRRAQSGT